MIGLKHKIISVFICSLLNLSVLLFAHDERQTILEVYLKKSCIIEADRLFFKDIVQSYSGNPVSSQLGNLSLPFTNDRLTIIPACSIRQAIKDKYSGTMILVGQRTNIIPKKLVNDGNVWFYEALLEYLGSYFSSLSARIEAEIISISDIPSSPDGRLEFDIYAVKTRNGIKLGPVRIGYRYYRENTQQSGDIDADLHVIMPAAVPKSLIRSGEIFAEDKLSIRPVDLASCDGDVLLWRSAITSFIAGGDLGLGEVIPLKKISRTISVRSGDKVSVTFVRKNLTVVLGGRALSSGGIDDRVTVKPDGSQRKFLGTITGDREVVIDL